MIVVTPHTYNPTLFSPYRREPERRKPKGDYSLWVYPVKETSRSHRIRSSQIAQVWINLRPHMCNPSLSVIVLMLNLLETFKIN